MFQEPKILPGKIFAVTSFYNPSRYKIKKQNYLLFRESLLNQNIPLLTIELSFNSHSYELGKNDAELLYQMTSNNIMWQKERLFNIAINLIPADCDKIVFLDCDIIFLNPSWVSETSRLLETYSIVHPYSHVIRLPKGKKHIDIKNCPVGFDEGQIMNGFGYGITKFGKAALNNYEKHGLPGGGWAIRRELIQNHGFYDVAILGGGDYLFAQAIFNNNNSRIQEIPPPFRRHYLHWASAFYNSARGSLGYTKGIILHLWHGKQKNRQYRQRHKILHKYRFDPAVDLVCFPDGPWQWGSEKKELHKSVKEYFKLRREDGFKLKFTN